MVLAHAICVERPSALSASERLTMREARIAYAAIVMTGKRNHGVNPMDDSFESLGIEVAALALSGLFRMLVRDRWNHLCQNTFAVDFNFQPLAC